MERNCPGITEEEHDEAKSMGLRCDWPMGSNWIWVVIHDMTDWVTGNVSQPKKTFEMLVVFGGVTTSEIFSQSQRSVKMCEAFQFVLLLSKLT